MDSEPRRTSSSSKLFTGNERSPCARGTTELASNPKEKSRANKPPLPIPIWSFTVILKESQHRVSSVAVQDRGRTRKSA